MGFDNKIRRQTGREGERSCVMGGGGEFLLLYRFIVVFEFLVFPLHDALRRYSIYHDHLTIL